MSTKPAPTKFQFISYAEFGQKFFEHAVSAERIQAQFSEMAGEESTIGPMPADPMGMVKVMATTRTGEPAIRRARGDNITFSIGIPIDLDLTIDVAPQRVKLTLGGLLPDLNILGGKIDASQKLKYKGKVSVNLTLTARAANPLLVVIDIERPSAKSVKVNLEADGILATLLQTSGVLEGEIKKAVAKEVRRELDNPKLQAGLVIDVGAQMDEMA